MTNSPFTSLGLSESITQALVRADYHTLTPVQAKAIPAQLAGRDVLGVAQTGTGKTAAFVLPILQKLGENRRHALPRTCRALILAPTRELALQISQSIGTYGQFMNIRHMTITGGVSQRNQTAALKNGVDLVVATPGRLIDLINQKQIDLGRTEHFVLDEADRMLDIGFIRDVRRIASLVPAHCQTVLFSATMPRDVKQLADEILKEPVRVEIAAKSVAVDRIDQQIIHLPSSEKHARLCELLADAAVERVVIFTRTKRRADRVAAVLKEAGVRANAIHGNKAQGARQKALDQFRSGGVQALVATDIVARGIDVEGITHVINFDLPDEPESYVHRIGRTARAGKSGIAISFCDISERKQLTSIERLTKTKLKVLGNALPDTGGADDPIHALPRDGGVGADKNSAPRNRNRRRKARNNQMRKAA